MDSMDDLQRKVSISIILSDLKVLQKLPHGRVDELVRMPLPDWFERAVETRRYEPAVGRKIALFARDLRVQERENARSDRKARVTLVAAVLSDGRVHLKKSLIRRLVAAGRDYARDFWSDYQEGADAEQTLAGSCSDLAKSMLTAEGVIQNLPGYERAALVEAATDYVYEGMQKVRPPKRRRKA